MGFVNKVMLLGNATRDPELRQLPTGAAVCEFGLATNRIYKTLAGEEKQEAVFVDCTAFGRQAEVLGEFCRTGKPLFIEGRLHFENWEDKNGQRRSKLTVIVESFQFVGGREQQKPADAAQGELPLSSAPPRRENTPSNGKRSATPSRLLKGSRTSSTQTLEREDRSPQRAVATADRGVDHKAREAQDLDDADLPF